MNKDLITYYKNRAKEYEKVYLKAERQDSLVSATILLQNIFSNKNVLEIACGTGFWTEKIAQTAKFVLATDINKSVLEMAEQKLYPKNNVSFRVEDIFNLSINEEFDHLFGGFIWSHIKTQELDAFLNIINNLVPPGSTIVFMDNNFIEGNSTPITSTDDYGNTFQTRKLNDGSTHLILKNFPSKGFLQEKFNQFTNDFQFINYKYYWLLIYKTPPL